MNFWWMTMVWTAVLSAVAGAGTLIAAMWLRWREVEVLEASEPPAPTVREIVLFGAHRATLEDQEQRASVCRCAQCEAVRIRLGLRSASDWKPGWRKAR